MYDVIAVDGAGRLLQCKMAVGWYCSEADDVLGVAIDQRRDWRLSNHIDAAATSGKSSLARSTTGEFGIRPLNHGFTVWRSDDATSTGSGAISARM